MAVVGAAAAGSWASSAVGAELLLATGGFYSASAGAIIGGSALTAAVGGAIAGAIVSSAVGSALGALGGQGGDPAFGPAGILLNKAANNAPIPVIYGQRKVGGTRVFAGVSGDNNAQLHMVIALGEGEIDSVENVYLNDVLSTDEIFDDRPEPNAATLRISTYTGTESQSADSWLVSHIPEWTTDHKLLGTAYLVATMSYHSSDEDLTKAYATGIPTFTADVKGVKVYDPRTATTAWSNNPALCLRDYLTNSRYGRGIDTSLIDDTSFVAAANYCETQVTIGGEEKDMYTLNGVVNTSQGSMDVIKQLLTACRGFLIFSGGKYKLIIDKPETANFTFSEDNIVGAWSITLGSKTNQFNRVRANFFNPDRQWQSDIAAVDSTALRTLDNELLLEQTIDLPFTSDIDRAKMIATIHLNQSRQQIAVEFNATIEGLRCEVGDVVYVSHAMPGWDTLNGGSGKLFRVVGITLQNNDEVRVSCIEYALDSYDYGTIAASDSAPNTNLPDPSVVAAPTTLVLASELRQGTAGNYIEQITVGFAASGDAFVEYYLLSYKPTAEDNWKTKNIGAGVYAIITDIEIGVSLDVKVVAVNIRGVISSELTDSIIPGGTNSLVATDSIPDITGPSGSGQPEAYLKYNALNELEAITVRASYAVAGSELHPTGTAVIWAESDVANQFTCTLDSSSKIYISADEIMSTNEDATILTGSTTTKLIIANGTTQVLSDNTNYHEYMWVATYDSGDVLSEYKKVIAYDDTALYLDPADPLSFTPVVGKVVKQVEYQWNDMRTADFRLLYCDGEVLRWTSVDKDGTGYYLNVVREQQGTTQVDCIGKTVYYFPAVGDNIETTSEFSEDSGMYHIDYTFPTDISNNAVQVSIVAVNYIQTTDSAGNVRYYYSDIKHTILGSSV